MDQLQLPVFVYGSFITGNNVRIEEVFRLINGVKIVQQTNISLAENIFFYL